MLRLKTILRCLLGGLFLFAGVAHFLVPDKFLRIMPPYVPWHEALVAASGAFEIVLGLLVLIPHTAPLAAWGLIALLVAVFPANIHMALHTDRYPEFEPVVLWVRLPLQGVLIVWAYWYTKTARSRDGFAAPKSSID